MDEDGKVALIIGAAGGSKITSTLTSIMALYLWNNYDIKEAIDAPRLYHQVTLYNNYLLPWYEAT